MSKGTVYLEDLELGMSRSLTRTITEEMVEKFADVADDHNPIHFDEEVAKASPFEGRVAHGMLSASFFSGLVGEYLPGRGSIYMGQNLKFLAPVRIGDEVTAIVTVSEINTEKKRTRLITEAKVGDTLVITGEALVLAPSRG